MEKHFKNSQCLAANYCYTNTDENLQKSEGELFKFMCESKTTSFYITKF